MQFLASLDSRKLRSFFESEYDKHKNIHNPLVNWDNQKLTKVRMSNILFCLGGKILTQFLSRIA